MMNEDQLLDYSDYPTVRQDLRDKVLKAVQESPPATNEQFTLRVTNPKFRKAGTYSLKKQKEAILSGQTLSDKLVGNYELVDNETGEVVGKTNQKLLMNVPYLTDRGTYIRNGTEYTVSKQFRLAPGVYTRTTDDGKVEAQFNAKPRTGSSFRIFMEPDSGHFYLRYKNRKIPLYPVLRAMGVPQERLEKAWGKELVDQNRKLERSPYAINFLKQFQPREGMKEEILAAVQKKAAEAWDVHPLWKQAGQQKTMPLPENPDKIEELKKDNISFHAGANDWESGWTSIWAHQGPDAYGSMERVWFMVKPSEGKTFNNDSPEDEQESEEWSRKALKTWIKKYKEFRWDREKNPEGASAGPPALAAALKSDEMKPFVKEVGFDRTSWSGDQMPGQEKEAAGVEYNQELRQSLVEEFNQTELDPRTTRRTLGKEYLRASPEAMMAATVKVLNVNRGKAETDSRDSLAYQDIHDISDFLSEKIKNDQGGVLGKVLWKLTGRGQDMKKVPASLLDDHVQHLFTASGVAQAAEEINPSDMYDQNMRVVRLGEGALPSVDVAPKESRDVQPSYFGYIDPIVAPECYSADTEVFTRTGWKAWPAVLEDDELACLIDGNLQYHKPVRLIRHDVDQDLYGCDHRAVSYLVTGNHRMWVRPMPHKKKGFDPEYRIESAADIHDNNRKVRIGGHGPFEGSCSEFSLPVVDKESNATKIVEEPIPMSLWSRFMGWYLSEGSTIYRREDSTYIVSISQSEVANPSNWGEIEDLLSELPFNFKPEWDRRAFHAHGRQLAEYLKDFGYCNDKWIPDEIFEASVEDKEAFLDAFEKGDGRRHRDGRIASLCTTSRKLAEDLHRLIFEIGGSSVITFEPDEREEHYLGCWVVYRHKRTERMIHYKIPGTGLSHHYKEHYRGTVYCAEVPGGLLYVRRKDRCGFWCGNSLRIGLDMRLARNVRRGPDKQLYTQLVSAKTGEPEWVGVREATEKNVGFPEGLNNNVQYVPAMSRGRQMRYIDRKDVDYYLSSGDDMFSDTANLVPLKSGVKGMRLLMGNKFSRQALPLVKREAPLVQTKSSGDQSEEARLGPYMGAVKAKKGGTVKSVYKDHIKVVEDDGNERVYEIYNNYPYARQTFVRNTPKVKAGDTVKPGQLLATSNYTDDTGVSALGTNLSVAYLNYDGKVFEDAAVISESASKKLTSEHMYTTRFEKESDVSTDKAKFRALFPSKYSKAQLANITEEGAVKPGTVVKYGDPLVLATREREPTPQTMGRRLRTDDSVTWQHKFPGVVTDAVPSKKGYTINARANVPMQVADKVSGRYGNKGVVSEIVPDSEMPQDSKGNPIDIIFSPLSIHSRTNPAQKAEAVLGKVAEKTGKPYVLPGFTEDPEQDISEFARREAQRVNIDPNEDLVDPRTGKTIPGVLTGKTYVYKLQHTAEKKGKARSTSKYTAEDQPARGGKTGCFPGHQKVLTLHGERRISSIVEKKLSEQVWSRGADGMWGFNPITSWFTYRAAVTDLLCVEIANASSVCGGKRVKHTSCMYPTKNHEVYLFNGNKVLAEELRVGDALCTWGPLITQDQKSVILGSLLGDGYISDGTFQEMHSLKQRGYTGFKQGVLSGLCAALSGIRSEGKTPDGKSHKRCLLTVPQHYVGQWASEICYIDGKKAVTDQWLEQLDDLALSVWLLDDGYITNRSKKRGGLALQGELATNGFSKEEVDRCVGWLRRRLRPAVRGVRAVPVSSGSDRTQWKVFLSAEACGVLVRIIARHIPSSAIPGSKRKLRELVAEIQATRPSRQLQYTCDIGTIPAIVRDIRPYQHPKPGATDLLVYDFEVRGVHTYTAGNVLVSNSKHIGDMEIQSLLAHGADKVLKDLKLIKGQKNDQFWRQLKLGQTPAMPDTPMVYEKFKSLLKASGINLQEDRYQDNIFGMTNNQAKELTQDREIKQASTYDAKRLRPIPGGLFDPEATGSMGDGDRWSYIKLPQPMPNPIMAEPLRRILGMKKKEFDAVVAGEQDVDGKHGADAIEALLKRVNISSLKDRTLSEIKTGAKSKRDNAVKLFRYLDAMEKQKVKPGDFMMDRVPVLPPKYRPITRQNDMTMVADPNYLYKQLLESIEDYRDAQDLPESLQNEARADIWKSYKTLVGITDPEQQQLQKKNVGGLLKQIFGKGSPKFGFTQRRVIGTNIDISGLGVVTPNPSLKLNQVGMPEPLAWQLYEPFVIREMVQNGHNATEAAQEVKNHTPGASAALREVIKTRPVLVNRAPTLHKYSNMAFDPVLVKGSAVQVSPAIVKPFGMDFNGDSCKLLSGNDLLLIKDHDSVRVFQGFEDLIKACFCPQYEESKALEEFGEQTTVFATKSEAELYVIGMDKEHIPSWQRIEALTIHTSHGPVCYKVSTSRGLEAVFTAHHNFLTYCSDMTLEVVKTGDLEGRLIPKARSVELPEHTKKVTRDNVEYTLDFEAGMFIGYWLGDGSLTGREDTVSVSSTEERILSSLEKIGSKFSEKAPWREGNGKSSRWTDKKFYRFLKEDFGYRSFSKKLPDWVFTSPSEFKRGILVGFAEAEGACCSSLQIEVNNQWLLQQLKVLFDSFSIPCTVTKGHPASDKRRATHILRFPITACGDLILGAPEEFPKLREALQSREHTAIRNVDDIVPFSPEVREAIKGLPVVCRESGVKSSHLDVSAGRGYCSRALADSVVSRYGLDDADNVDKDILINWTSLVMNRDLMWDKITEFSQCERPPVTYDFSTAGAEMFSICGTYLVHNTASFTVPVSKEAVEQARELMYPEKNLLSSRFGKPAYVPSNEYLQGLYFATKPPRQKPVRIFKSMEEAMKAYQAGEIRIDDPIRVVD